MALVLASILALAACVQDRQEETAASGGLGSSAAPEASAGATASAPISSLPATIPNEALDPEAVTETIARVADWSLEHPDPIDPASWVMAPLYDGLISTSLVTGDPRYMAAVIRAGLCVLYETGSRTFHADGQAAGRSWLRLYEMMEPKDEALLEPWEELFDRIVAEPPDDDLSFLRSPPPDRRVTDRWTWTDALYMAPPTIVVLYDLTGDDRYLEFMDAEFRFAYENLYDSEANLWYRDERYIDDRTENGDKVFWSRGNAWVYAGLALVLERLPEDWPTRPFYVELFQQMTEAVVGAQQPDGFWYPNLADPEDAPTPEASGTALFVLGLASGIGQGLIDGDESWPVVERGWEAILTAVDEDGAVNFVQPPASLPDVFPPESRVPYGTGAVLGAGAAIVEALGAAPDLDRSALFDDARDLADDAPDLWTQPEREEEEACPARRGTDEGD